MLLMGPRCSQWRAVDAQPRVVKARSAFIIVKKHVKSQFKVLNYKVPMIQRFYGLQALRLQSSLA
jgi:hypothetical protein